MNYYYTVCAPTDTAVTIVGRTLDLALDMAAVDLARGWFPVNIVFDQGRLDSAEILALLQQRRAKRSLSILAPSPATVTGPSVEAARLALTGPKRTVRRGFILGHLLHMVHLWLCRANPL